MGAFPDRCPDCGGPARLFRIKTIGGTTVLVRCFTEESKRTGQTVLAEGA